MGAPDVGNAGFRQPGKSYLALSDQIPDRAGHVLDRYSAIDAVLIKQIDKLGAKPAQAALHRLTDMRGPAVHADDLIAIETRAKLRGDHYLMAPALERSAQQLFVGKGAVVLRRVEEVASSSMARCSVAIASASSAGP